MYSSDISTMKITKRQTEHETATPPRIHVYGITCLFRARTYVNTRGYNIVLLQTVAVN